MIQIYPWSNYRAIVSVTRLLLCIVLTSTSAVKDTLLHLTYPIQTASGTTTSEVFVPTGTLIIMGLLETNSDPRIWGPDAREWKPERWLQPLPQSVKDVKMPGVYSDM
jgi:Cytochrome P450